MHDINKSNNPQESPTDGALLSPDDVMVFKAISYTIKMHMC